MVVQDLIESRELFADETKEGVFIVYEKFETGDCQCDGRTLREIECDEVKEIVQIFQGSQEGNASLVNVESYCVGEQFATLEDVKTDIRNRYEDLFLVPVH
ncbi:hypothetical protein [Texcoconibacillus texcoconensis]|uniref:Uncharacterized protein n=1 Tax=Texcoconibacillus texcoconensis TaxID=1095777 RepID=A0A840QNQ4_9BACI|nr:hypothetical protein [Texcoconibacillus texcoconensis]MBB5173004.1 hypothetical protein [Texcoconibacillus texcoconensis]